MFFGDEDRSQYLEWFGRYGEKYGLETWAYCLMSNHVHIVAVPHREDALARTFSATHMRYAQRVNRRLRQAGHLWQGRFFSCPLDEAHATAAVRYVERNPVRAGMASAARDWPWSSALAHLNEKADPLLARASWPPDDLRRDWAALLDEPEPKEFLARIRQQTYTGRPLGSEAFIAGLERLAGRLLHPLPKGRPKKESAKTDAT